MEIINVNGYTLEEKIEIANKHLFAKQLQEHGINKDKLSLNKSVLEKIIDGYTRESGVRGLEKQLAKLIPPIIRVVAERAQRARPRLRIELYRTRASGAERFVHGRLLGREHFREVRPHREERDVGGRGRWRA